MGIVGWIMVGLIAGFIAHAFLGGRGGILPNIAVGLVGAVVGGFLFAKMHIVVEPGFGGSLITASIGAVIFLAIWRAIRSA